MTEKEVIVRKVWAKNFHEEFRLLTSVINEFNLVAFDTEFSGTVIELDEPYYQFTRWEKFQNMIINVNSTKLIQLGICLSDYNGNLPSFGTNNYFIWEFNFREFDERVDPHNPSSIDMLKSQGIDFEKNREEGIDACEFARIFLKSVFGIYYRAAFGGRGMVEKDPNITWIMFHSLFDLGYLIRVLANHSLPENQFQFVTMVFGYLGFNCYDAKEIGFAYDFRGGLEGIAKNLGVSRKGGKSHQASSDSLLTMEVFLKLKKNYFEGEDLRFFREFNHKLYGLNKFEFSDIHLAFQQINHRRFTAAAVGLRNRTVMQCQSQNGYLIAAANIAGLPENNRRFSGVPSVHPNQLIIS